jgi:ParB family chromosome partitioning protein
MRKEVPAAGNDASPAARSRVNPGKIRSVAEILGLSDGDEEEIPVRLTDEFLAQRSASGGTGQVPPR